MVFSEDQYSYRFFVRGTPGITADLVASQYITGLEDRTHDSDPRAELAALSINHGIRSDDQGILQTAQHNIEI